MENNQQFSTNSKINNDQILNMINYNMKYLAENNIYQEKIKELEKEISNLKRERYDLLDEIEYTREDYRVLLNKYKKANPPKIYNEKKRKIEEITKPNIIKKRRRSKYSLKEDQIDRIFFSINSIDDIINLEKYGKNIYHDPKLVKLINIIPPLKKLKDMVGLKEIKDTIFKHILFFIQGLNNEEMYHTVISGPPGVGKTELGKILGSIYLGLGILKNDIFRVVKRSELIGKYLGHTAAQTQAIIDECQGGIMFIDEAYSLGNEEKRDSFSKECLDTINQNLTENKSNFMCIIAGYKDSLNKCFFSYNDGLKRRFPFWYDIEGYSPEELKEIFKRKVSNQGWKLDALIPDDFFKEKFEFFGGDIETFTFYSKMAYSKRIFNNSKTNNRILILEDLKNGFKTFEENKEKLKKKNYKPPFGMYI